MKILVYDKYNNPRDLAQMDMYPITSLKIISNDIE
jgi:hypothetical protein